MGLEKIWDEECPTQVKKWMFESPYTGRDFVQFGKTESGLNKGAEKIAPLFNPPPVLSLETIPKFV